MASHLMMLLIQGGASTVASSWEAEYLVVAGGGGGGAIASDFVGVRKAGGGGAGGLLSGTTTLVRGVPVSIETGGPNSVFGDIETFVGGSGGSVESNGNATSGGNGGSGGGGAQTGGQFGRDGGLGTPGQGNDGTQGSENQAGSGGSASVTSFSITGSAVSYAIGGSGIDSGITPPPNTGNGGTGEEKSVGTGIVVEGAGTSAANGTYEPDGEHNGRTMYRLGSTDYTIRWSSAVGDHWSIDFGEGGIYLLGGGGSPGGPASEIDGAAPAPTVGPEITTIPATAGASGVVILAYPDTLPSLTVSSGLTYDQPTRAGYRVYRFTSGTGTITP